MVQGVDQVSEVFELLNVSKLFEFFTPLQMFLFSVLRAMVVDSRPVHGGW